VFHESYLIRATWAIDYCLKGGCTGIHPVNHVNHVQKEDRPRHSEDTLQNYFRQDLQDEQDGTKNVFVTIRIHLWLECIVLSGHR
jgi:hypothetical protein